MAPFTSGPGRLRARRGNMQLSAKTVTIVLVIVALIVGGGIAFAFYREEITSFVSLRAWDREAPKRVMLQFIQNCHSENGQAAWECLDRTHYLEPIYTGKRLTAVKWSTPNGVVTTPVTKWAPVGEVKSIDIEPRERAGVPYFLATVEYGNGQWALWRLERVQGELKIVHTPDYIGNERPKLLFGD